MESREWWMERDVRLKGHNATMIRVTVTSFEGSMWWKDVFTVNDCRYHPDGSWTSAGLRHIGAKGLAPYLNQSDEQTEGNESRDMSDSEEPSLRP